MYLPSSTFIISRVERWTQEVILLGQECKQTENKMGRDRTLLVAHEDKRIQRADFVLHQVLLLFVLLFDVMRMKSPSSYGKTREHDDEGSRTRTVAKLWWGRMLETNLNEVHQLLTCGLVTTRTTTTLFMEPN